MAVVNLQYQGRAYSCTAYPRVTNDQGYTLYKHKYSNSHMVVCGESAPTSVCGGTDYMAQMGDHTWVTVGRDIVRLWEFSLMGTRVALTIKMRMSIERARLLKNCSVEPVQFPPIGTEVPLELRTPIECARLLKNCLTESSWESRWVISVVGMAGLTGDAQNRLMVGACRWLRVRGALYIAEGVAGLLTSSAFSASLFRMQQTPTRYCRELEWTPSKHRFAADPVFRRDTYQLLLVLNRVARTMPPELIEHIVLMLFNSRYYRTCTWYVLQDPNGITVIVNNKSGTYIPMLPTSSSRHLDRGVCGNWAWMIVAQLCWVSNMWDTRNKKMCILPMVLEPGSSVSTNGHTVSVNGCVTELYNRVI